MSILLVRQQIDKKLDELSPEMLKAIHTLLYGAEAKVVEKTVQKDSFDDHGDEDYDINGNLLDRDDLIQEFENINDRIDSGQEETKPWPAVKNRIEQWLENTK